MKKFTLAVCGLLGLTQGAKSINYDYTCRARELESCLVNDIYLTGPNVVLVNLDNSCQVDKLEREGIFLQTGDLLFVTGRQHTAAYQDWEDEYEEKYSSGKDCHCGGDKWWGSYYEEMDFDVLFPGLDYDMPLKTAPGYHQNIVVLEAVSPGMTTYDTYLNWGGDEVRHVSLDVYVD